MNNAVEKQSISIPEKFLDLFGTMEWVEIDDKDSLLIKDVTVNPDQEGLVKIADTRGFDSKKLPLKYDVLCTNLKELKISEGGDISEWLIGIENGEIDLSEFPEFFIFFENVFGSGNPILKQTLTQALNGEEVEMKFRDFISPDKKILIVDGHGEFDHVGDKEGHVVNMHKIIEYAISNGYDLIWFGSCRSLDAKSLVKDESSNPYPIAIISQKGDVGYQFQDSTIAEMYIP